MEHVGRRIVLPVVLHNYLDAAIDSPFQTDAEMAQHLEEIIRLDGVESTDDARAVIDTGSTTTLVDPFLIAELDLSTKCHTTPTTIRFAGSSVERPVDRYRVAITLFPGAQPILATVGAIDLEHGPNVNMILGMDVISKILLTVDGFKFCYSLAVANCD